MSTLKALLLLAGTVYLAALLLAFLFQERLIFLPAIGRSDPIEPEAAGLLFERVPLATADRETLEAWWFPHPHSRGTVLLFHGNAGHIGHRLPYAGMFHEMGYELLLFDYRGYGRSTGRPTEAGVLEDGRTAWKYLERQRGVRPERAVFFGESLGGAVAAQLAREVQPAVLVLASTFVSVPELARDHYPWLPARWLARVRLDARASLAGYCGAVLVAHSPEDEIVPFRHGQALLDAAGEPKAFLELRGGHNDGFVFARNDWIERLVAFLSAHLP